MEEGEESAVLSDGVRTKYKLSRRDMMKLIVGYWFLGLCNNVGYVAALTAAHDLLEQIKEKPAGDEFDIKKDFNRDCNVISTGALLMADIFPSIFAKLFAPFCPLMIKIRYIIIIGFSVGGFLMMAFGFETVETSWIGIFGIVFISLSSGLGESSAVAYTSFFPTINAISAWSSGTGGAGVIGSTIYAGLKQSGVNSKATIMIMLIWPIIMAVSFYVLIPHPKIERMQYRLATIESATNDQIKDTIPVIEDPHTFAVKLQIIRKIFFVYVLPYSLTYYFEYLINHALYEVIYYPDDFLDRNSQYRWYQSAYQLGVFIARSSVNLIRVPYLYLLALIQFLNFTLFLFEALLGFLIFLAVCIFICFWEGIIAGTAYVNTYARMVSEVPPLQREFTAGINALGGDMAIGLAGMVGIPIHSLLCTSRNPYEIRKEKP